MPNAPLLYQTLGFLETHPEYWDQGNWASIPYGQESEKAVDPFKCEAKGCFAGWAAIFSGALWSPDGSSAVSQDGTVIGSIDEYARDALGLNEYQSNRLFNGSNTIADMKQVIKEIVTPPKASVHTFTIKASVTPEQAETIRNQLNTALIEGPGRIIEYTEVEAETIQEEFTRRLTAGQFTSCCSTQYANECGQGKENFEKARKQYQ